ncbi:MAG TPA: hypothetical protein ENH97_03395 [bacterium]|nr:hypothetical protein [bacterium]
MNWLDGIIIIALAYGLIRGLFKGFFREVFQLLGIVLAAIIAFHYFKALGNYLVSLFNWPVMVANGVGFLLISLVVAGVCYLLGLFLRRATRFLAIRWLDIIGGGGFGVLKLALIVSLLLNVALIFSSGFPSIQEGLEREFNKAILAEPVRSLAPAILKIFPGKYSFDFQALFKKASKTKEEIQTRAGEYKKGKEMIEEAKKKIENLPKEYKKVEKKLGEVLK